MPKLTDRQLVILSAAAQAEGGAVLPLPKSLKLNKAAATSVLKGLVKSGLVAERPASRGAEEWREAEDGRRLTLVITEAGLEALGVVPEASSSKPAAAKSRSTKRGGPATPRPSTAKPKSKASRAARKRPAGKPTPDKAKGKAPAAARAGTKQALLIDLLERKKGATIADAVDATGWQPHSVRGAISGTLKKKLGLTVTSAVVESRGRVYRIAGCGRAHGRS